MSFITDVIEEDKDIDGIIRYCVIMELTKMY